MYPEKTFRPDNLRLLVNPFRKISPVARCDDSKRSSSRQPSAFGHSSTKSLSSLRRFTPKKRSRQIAFGFGVKPRKKSRQPSEMYPEKTFRPEGLRLLVNPFWKISPVARCDGSKKCNSRQPSTFGQSPAKSPVSLRRYTPEKCLRPSASGCFFTPIVRPLKRPAAMTRKSVAPDDLRLLVDASQKKTASLRRCTPKKRSRQVAFGFWSIPCKKPRQPSEMRPEKTLRPDGLWLLVDTPRKVPPAFRNVPQPFASGCRL